MNHSRRVGLIAAVAALGSGTIVADASNHASFASSTTPNAPGAYGNLLGGGPDGSPAAGRAPGGAVEPGPPTS
jgi:hypothetical protein